MARAEILIEDGDPIGAAVRFVFVDGFVPASPAHQLTNIVRKILDDMAAAGELTALHDPEYQGDMAEANEALAQTTAETGVQPYVATDDDLVPAVADKS